jgi:transcription initiation factor IIE alpha subunit
MISAGTIRDLNNKYGADQERNMVCPKCSEGFTSDLAKYHGPTFDAQLFACPDCDELLWLRFEPSAGERIAQRRAA